MPVEGPTAVTSERLRHHERTRKKSSSGLSKPFLRASHPRPAATAARSSEDEINRLKDNICKLQAERQLPPSGEETDGLTDGLGPGGVDELRWRINQLEGDKLELASKHNNQVSSLESQVARLRATVERGEAQRQTLEYDMAVARKEAAAQRTEHQDKMAALCTQNEQLTVHRAELQQRVCDLQKALNITRKAREEDQHALQQEVEERDRLVLSSNAENDQLTAESAHLHNLLQEQEKAIQELQRRMGELQKEKEGAEEALRRQTSELGFITTREERIKTELEAALQRVKNLEANIESERAAHLESKFNSEIIQLRVRDLEAALQVEKSAQAEAQSSLEMIKQQFREVEKAYSLERARAHDATHRLAQVEKDHQSSRAELHTMLEEEKRATSQLRQQLQELHTTHTHSLEHLDAACQRVVLLEEACESCLTEVHSLQLHRPVGPHSSPDRPVCGEAERKRSPSALVDVLRRTLTAYRTSLDRTTAEVQDQQQQSERLVQELQFNQTLISEQKRHIEECRSALSDCSTELQRLRAECSQKSLQADRLQADLQTAQQHWQRERDTGREEERGRAAELEAEIQKISQLYQRDSQVKLTFLHGLYQRLLAGYVLISQPQCILGSFSWEELCIVITEHVDALTSELTKASERLSHLEGVCESKSVCVTELKRSQECVLLQLEDKMKQQQEAWAAQRHETEQQHKQTVSQLQGKIQVYCCQLEEAHQRRSKLERERSQLTSDLSNLKCTLTQSDLQRSTLLSACILLAGALTHLTHTTHTLRMQKSLLTHCLSRRAGLEGEVRTLVHALAEGPVQRGGARRWRVCVVCVMAVNRLCVLRRGSRVLFRVGGPGYTSLGVCVLDQPPEDSAAPPKGKEDDDDGEGPGEVCVRWLRQKGLSSLFLTSMAELQDALADTAPSPQVVLSRAQHSLSVLLDGLHLSAPLTPSQGTRDTLVIRLGQGLHRLTANQMSCKVLVAALQQHFLVFTQRLSSAEVERRSLRLELASLKRVAKDNRQVGHKNPDIHLVPAERFERVCEELRLALQREQQAQGLLGEQAEQLRLVGDRMDTLSRENQERDHTLNQTVQNLAEARKEVGRKDQALRVVGKHLAGLQQQKRCLEESVRQAENALSTTAKSKDTLANYMKTVEFSYRQLRDHIVQSRSTSTGEHLPLQLPKMHLSLTATEKLLGGPEVAACQSLVGMFSEVYNAACSRIGSLEREISTHQSHVSALRTELQDACLRENLCFLPVCVSQSSVTPPLDNLWQPLVESEAPRSDPTSISPPEMNPCQPKTNSTHPLSDPPKKTRGSKKTFNKTGPAASTTASRR